MRRHDWHLLHRDRAFDLHVAEDRGAVRLRTADAEVSGTVVDVGNGEWTVEIGADRFSVHAERDGEVVWLAWRGRTFKISRQPPRRAGAAPAEDQARLDVKSPMTGRIVRVEIGDGAVVERGQVLVVVEAMKMEYQVRAAMSGRVTEVKAKAAKLVELGESLLRIERQT